MGFVHVTDSCQSIYIYIYSGWNLQTAGDSSYLLFAAEPYETIAFWVGEGVERREDRSFFVCVLKIAPPE